MLKNFIKRILSNLRLKIESQNIINGQTELGENTSMSGSEINGTLISRENCIFKKINVHGTVNIGRYTTLWGPNINLYGTIDVGCFCSIASNVSVFEKNHDINKLTTYYIYKNLFQQEADECVSKGKVIIGSDVWIGSGANILTGVEIGHGAVVAANSVVNINVPPYAVVGGVPAKILNYRFNAELIERLLELQWWEWPLEKIERNKSLFSDNISIEYFKNIK